MKNLIELQKKVLSLMKSTFLIAFGYVLSLLVYRIEISYWAVLMLFGVIFIIELIVLLTLFLAIGKSKNES